MTRLRPIALLLVLVGSVGIVYGILVGEIQVSLLFFVIPYLYGGTALGALSILAVVIGVVLLFVDAARRSVPEDSSPVASTEGEAKGRTGWGGVVIIGPIPIVFGSAPRPAMIALVITAAVLAALLLLLFLFVR